MPGLKLDESKTIEYKRELPKNNKKWLKSVVSFSNTSGGTIYIGIEDGTKKVVGINEDRGLLEEKIVNAINESVDPRPEIDLTFKTITNKSVVELKVNKGSNTPYYLIEGNKKEVYVRFGSSDRIASDVKIKELNRLNKDETYLKELYLYNGKQVEVTQEEIAELLNKLNELSKEDKKVNLNKLIQWGILVDMFDRIYATNGYILLTKNGFNNASVKIGVFKGIDKSVISKQVEFNGSIIEQYFNSYDFILENLRDGFEMGRTREPKFKIPLVALREILSNSILHRDYYDEQKIMISIFDDRIEFSSPGTLYDGITVDEIMNETSKLRNISIAEVFNYVGISEGWGSGINRANVSLRDNGQFNLILDTDSSSFIKVTIMFKQTSVKTIDENNEITRETFLGTYKEFTRRIVEDALSLTQDQARRLIERWSNEKLIDKVGDKSSTKYIVK